MKVGQFFITSSWEYGWTIDSRKMTKKWFQFSRVGLVKKYLKRGKNGSEKCSG